MANAGLLDGRVRLRRMTLSDRFIDQASPAAMYVDAGLTAADIARVAGGVAARPVALQLIRG